MGFCLPLSDWSVHLCCAPVDSSRWASSAGHLAFAMYAKEDEGPSGAGGVEDCDEDGRRQDLAEDLGPVAKLERYACSDIVFHR